MTGYSTIQKLRKTELDLAAMGMQLAAPKHGWGSLEYGDRLAVIPKDDELPIFCRDAELFIGTLEELGEWMLGVYWMHNYYSMLKLVDQKKIQKKEDEARHEILVRKLKEKPKDEEVVAL